MTNTDSRFRGNDNNKFMNIDTNPPPAIIEKYHHHKHEAKHDHIEQESYTMPFRIHLPVVQGSAYAVVGEAKPGDEIESINGKPYVVAKFIIDNKEQNI
jgi:hypothetical protein